MAVPTVQELAALVNRQLTRDKRDDGQEFIKLRDGSPEWMTELCHAAHADMMPNDWRYELIKDVLTLIENDDEEIDIDSLYPYTHSRLSWLSSRVDRSGYCDDAIKDYGATITRIDDAISLGMASELEEVKGLIAEFLEERASALEDEAIEGSNDADTMQEDR